MLKLKNSILIGVLSVSIPLITLNAQDDSSELDEKMERLKEVLGIEFDGQLDESAYEILVQELDSLGIEENELAGGYEFIGGDFGFQEYLDNNIDHILYLLGDEKNEFNDDEGEYAYEEDEGISDTGSGYSINIYGGFPIYKATTFETYDKANPVIGLSVGTPIGFNIGPFYANIGIELLNYTFNETGMDTSYGVDGTGIGTEEIIISSITSSSFGGNAYLAGLNTGFKLRGYDLNATITTGVFHAGTGFIAGGNFNIPMGNSPLKLRLSMRANIVQKEEGGATGWIGTGVSIGYHW